MGLFGRRKARLPGAEADWDTGEHVDMGGGLVMVPRRQFSEEAMKRLEGVVVYPGKDDAAEVLVLVNTSAAERDSMAEIASLADHYAPRVVDATSERRADELKDEWDRANERAMLSAFNDNWVAGGLEGVPEEDRGDQFMIMRVSLLTGLIEG